MNFTDDELLTGKFAAFSDNPSYKSNVPVNYMNRLGNYDYLRLPKQLFTFSIHREELYQNIGNKLSIISQSVNSSVSLVPIIGILTWE